MMSNKGSWISICYKSILKQTSSLRCLFPAPSAYPPPLATWLICDTVTIVILGFGSCHSWVESVVLRTPDRTQNNSAYCIRMADDWEGVKNPKSRGGNSVGENTCQVYVGTWDQITSLHIKHLVQWYVHIISALKGRDRRIQGPDSLARAPGSRRDPVENKPKQVNSKT